MNIVSCTYIKVPIFSVSKPGSKHGEFIIAPFLYNDDLCLINAVLLSGNLQPSQKVISYTPGYKSHPFAPSKLIVLQGV